MSTPMDSTKAYVHGMYDAMLADRRARYAVKNKLCKAADIDAVREREFLHLMHQRVTNGELEFSPATMKSYREA